MNDNINEVLALIDLDLLCSNLMMLIRIVQANISSLTKVLKDGIKRPVKEI